MQSRGRRPVHAGAVARRARGAACALLALVLAAAGTACGRGGGPTVVLQGTEGPVAVRVEIAATQADQARGLMFRSELAEDAGMLFVFPRAAPRSFWMKNTPLSLDILYIGEDLTIGHIAASTTPYSEVSIPSRGPARYVLEVNAGFCNRHGIGPGSRVELPDGLAAP
jgi:uncharacterized membrane protein (UPF0127 family)